MSMKSEGRCCWNDLMWRCSPLAGQKEQRYKNLSFSLRITQNKKFTLIKLIEWPKIWCELNLKSLCFVILYRHILINFQKCTNLSEWRWLLKPECLWLTCLLLEKIYQRSWEPAVVTSGRKQPVPLTRWVSFECTFTFLYNFSWTVSEVRGW